MFTPEILPASTGNRRERSLEEEMFLENMLQMAWFEERYTRLSEEEKMLCLQRIQEEALSEAERERISSASSEERKQIILEDMILSSSGDGGREREWYREVFLKLPESKQLLSQFETEPEAAAKAVEALYQRSLH